VIAADHDRSFQLAGCDHLIQHQSRLRTFAVTEPADARRQALKLDLLLGHRQPSREMIVVGEKIHDRFVGFVDVFLVTRQSDPAERALAFAKERADISRNKTRIIECVLDSVIESSLPRLFP
jgi:hypothetical protein